MVEVAKRQIEKPKIELSYINYFVPKTPLQLSIINDTILGKFQLTLK